MRAPIARIVSVDMVASARRIEERSALLLPAWVHPEQGQQFAAVITDLTTRGCRLECGEYWAIGTYVTIIMCSTLIGGRIAWSEEGIIGVEFGARLLPKTLRTLLSAVQ